MPVTALSMSRPSRSSSWVSSRACSSGGAARRRSRGASGGPGRRGSGRAGPEPAPAPVAAGVGRVVGEQARSTVSVLPTSMASSTVSPSPRRSLPARQVEPEVEHRGRVGQGPDRDEVGAGRGVGAGRSPRVDPAGHLDQRCVRRAGRPAAGRRTSATPLGVHVVEQTRVGAGRRPPRPPGRGGRTRPRPSVRATAPGPGPRPR